MIERRTFPRYPITFPVTFTLGSGENEQSFETQCVNISRASIEISAETAAVKAMLEMSEYPQQANLKFHMPSHKIMFCASAQVVTHRRLSQHQYYIVMVFGEFRSGSEELLDESLKEFEPGVFNTDTSIRSSYA